MKWVILAVVVVFSGLAVGCRTYDTVRISVRDAEIRTPIPNAQVAVHYFPDSLFDFLDPSYPEDASANTDEHGEAVMSVIHHKRGFMAEATGYVRRSLYDPRTGNRVEILLLRTGQ